MKSILQTPGEVNGPKAGDFFPLLLQSILPGIVPPRAKRQGVRSYPIHQCSDVDNHVCEHAGVVFPVFCELLDIWTHTSPVQKLPQAAVIGRKLLPETTLRRPTIGAFT